jgi:hypothetical protein
VLGILHGWFGLLTPLFHLLWIHVSPHIPITAASVIWLSPAAAPEVDPSRRRFLRTSALALVGSNPLVAQVAQVLSAPKPPMLGVITEEKENLARAIELLVEPIYRELESHGYVKSPVYTHPYCVAVSEGLIRALTTLGEAIMELHGAPIGSYPPYHQCDGLRTKTGNWIIDGTWQQFLPLEKRSSVLPKVLILETADLTDNQFLNSLGLPPYVIELYKNIITDLEQEDKISMPHNDPSGKLREDNRLRGAA